MDNELYHYGVKGMKWGKRKAKESPPRPQKKQLSDKQKRAMIIAGASVAATFLAAYGATKVYNYKVPKTIVVEETQRILSHHRWTTLPNGAKTAWPVFKDVVVSKTIPNPARKYFK